MAITITKSGDFLKIVKSGNRDIYILIDDMTMNIEGDYIQFADNKLRYTPILFSDVTSPSAASATLLATAISALTDTSGTADITTALTDGSQESQIVGIDSTTNNSTTPLSGGATFTGTGEQNALSDVMVSCKTDAAGTLYFDFSVDGSNWETFPTNGFIVASGIHEFHTAVKGGRYFRVRLVNGGSAQSYLRLKTYYGQFRHGNAPLNQSIGADSDAIVTRSVLVGATDGGSYLNVPVTQEGHLEVALHDPVLPFGSVHVENLTPVFQTDAVYGINSGQVLTTLSGSGAVTGDNNLFTCSTGTTIYSQGVLLGRKRLRYRAGQGVVGRFTALYSTPVANSYQIAGFGTASDGVYFGYGNTNDLSDTRFGILYVRGGVREVKTLTVSTGATSASNCTITLNGTAFTVPLTNASNIQRTVYEISTYTGYTGWDAYAASSTTVVFVRKSAGTTAGTQSFSAGTTGAAATIAQTKAGVASTDTFIPQSTWNGDKLDGTGASGINANWEKGNVFQIGIQYLGFGAITFQVEISADGNNPTWETVHVLNIPNTLTAPTFTNPSFPFTMAAYSAGSTTDLTVKSASFAGFIEGAKVLQGNRFSYFKQLTTVGDTNLQALITVMNTRYYQGKANQAVINLISVSGAIKHTSPVIYYLIRGGTLTGNPSFTQLSTNSCSVYDTSATTVTYTTGDQVLWTGHLGDTGEIDHHFGNGSFNAEELTLQPGEWVTLAAKATTGTPAYVTGSINTREDQ
jgi:hypothetical protein